MTGPFGVEISKGLPSALRSLNGKMTSEAAKKPVHYIGVERGLHPMVGPLPRAKSEPKRSDLDYMRLRIRAHNEGSNASNLMSSKGKSDQFWDDPVMAQAALRSGRAARKESRGKLTRAAQNRGVGAKHAGKFAEPNATYSPRHAVTKSDFLIFKMAWDEKTTPKYWALKNLSERGDTPAEKAAAKARLDAHSKKHAEPGKPTPDPKTNPEYKEAPKPGGDQTRGANGGSRAYAGGGFTDQEKANFKENTRGRGFHFNADDFRGGFTDDYERSQYGGKTYRERSTEYDSAKRTFKEGFKNWRKTTPGSQAKNAGTATKAAWNLADDATKFGVKAAGIGTAAYAVPVGVAAYSAHRQNKAAQKRAAQRKARKATLTPAMQHA